MITLPEVRVGEPIRHETLTVFPLFSPPAETVEYLLSDEAINAGAVTVEEVSEGGSVPNLLVSNTGDCRVLFLEGEELKGAKQNRVLNTSVLVAAGGLAAGVWATARPVARGRAMPTASRLFRRDGDADIFDPLVSLETAHDR